MTDIFEQEFEDMLMHYGTKKHSGRYPWGSGDNPHQRNKDFLAYVDGLAKQGLSELEIAQGIGVSTNQLRKEKKLAKTAVRAANQSEAKRLADSGMSNIAIGKQMGINESSVRDLLNPSRVEANNRLENTANLLKRSLENNDAIDISTGTELYAGVSRTQLLQAAALLEKQGYPRPQYERVEQASNPGKFTTIMVIRRPDVDWKDIRNNQDRIGTIDGFTTDGGKTIKRLQKPLAIDPKRVDVRYGPDGGDKMDGVIQLRRGVDDISLGGSQYAQVRVQVGDGHYLKGMAMYTDDLPAGVDIRFNTNKSKTDNKLDALKPLKRDADGKVDERNPFGSQIRRQLLDDKDRPTSAMNIVNEEGKWNEWTSTLSSQVVSKQSTKLADKQLGLLRTEKRQELDEIMALTNPEVKKRLLKDFSDGADASAVSLHAASLPRQRTQVILPVNSLKDTEVFAPNFRDGEKVVLVRYPHGGIFEIPELTVNNRNREAISAITKGAKDAVGINSEVAGRLSGADFDGDTVLVIPNNNRSIKTASPLRELKGFNPQEAYPAYEGMPKMSARTKQIEMGKVSNLITDMTIAGAPHSEIAKAVKHSMVVIDAEKHNLNYRQSAKDNDIARLKREYQTTVVDGKVKVGGASTVVSRASSTKRVDDRIDRRASEGGWIDPKTGERRYTKTGATYFDGSPKQIESTLMAETRDARKLIGDTSSVMENLYANHANELKAMANEARKGMLSAGSTKWDPSAKRAYANEVASLTSQLNTALKNAPRERQAQVLARAQINQKKAANPGMDPATLKKESNLAIADARARTGAGKTMIRISDDEWKAISNGAISSSMLLKILDHADPDRVRELATPRAKTAMTGAKEARAKAMSNSGYTASEIAERLGVSVSTVHEVLGGA